MRVATKELKNRLSHYLHLVRNGERVLVTDRGTVVAELRSAREPAGDDEDVLRRLETSGVITVGRGRPVDFAPLRPHRRGKLSRFVIEGRD